MRKMRFFKQLFLRDADNMFVGRISSVVGRKLNDRRSTTDDRLSFGGFMKNGGEGLGLGGVNGPNDQGIHLGSGLTPPDVWRVEPPAAPPVPPEVPQTGNASILPGGNRTLFAVGSGVAVGGIFSWIRRMSIAKRLTAEFGGFVDLLRNVDSYYSGTSYYRSNFATTDTMRGPPAEVARISYEYAFLYRDCAQLYQNQLEILLRHFDAYTQGQLAQEYSAFREILVRRLELAKIELEYAYAAQETSRARSLAVSGQRFDSQEIRDSFSRARAHWLELESTEEVMGFSRNSVASSFRNIVIRVRLGEEAASMFRVTRPAAGSNRIIGRAGLIIGGIILGLGIIGLVWWLYSTDSGAGSE